VTKLRLGIVGVGRHGSRYARHAAKDVDAIELVAVCRRDAVVGGDLAATLGCDYVGDAHALLDRTDIDAVVLVTVPNLIEELVEHAVATGKRLLVEKPVAPSLEAGMRIARRLADAGTFCMAGHTLRFNGVVSRIRELTTDLGRIDSLIFSQRFPPQLQLGWLDDPARSGGGNILHTGVHCFDLIDFLSGLTPDSVSCTMHGIYTRRTEDIFGSEIRFRDSDATALVSCSRTTHSRNGLIEISGEAGQLIGDHVHGTLYRIDADGRTDLGPVPARHTVLEALERLAADVAADREPSIPYLSGLRAVAVADACYRSAASSQREHVVMPDSRP